MAEKGPSKQLPGQPLLDVAALLAYSSPCTELPFPFGDVLEVHDKQEGGQEQVADRPVGPGVDAEFTEIVNIGLISFHDLLVQAGASTVHLHWGTPRDELRLTREMYGITVSKNPNYTLPALNFAGTPTWIDILRVLDSGIAPAINTGIAHREPGIGQVGAGLLRGPLQCLAGAARALCNRYMGRQLQTSQS